MTQPNPLEKNMSDELIRAKRRNWSFAKDGMNQKTVTVEIANLTGAALDFAVAKCEKLVIQVDGASAKCDPCIHSEKYQDLFNPSENWLQGGPIVELEIDNYQRRSSSFYAHRHKRHDIVGSHFNDYPSEPESSAYGDTLLIASLRCYAIAKLGKTIEIPEILLALAPVDAEANDSVDESAPTETPTGG
jgi:hypothetical protein